MNQYNNQISGQGIGSPPLVTKAEIDSACSRLEHNIELLMKNVSNLTSRIQPVLGKYETPKPTGKDQPGMKSQMGERLQGMVNTLENLNDNVGELIGKIEL